MKVFIAAVATMVWAMAANPVIGMEMVLRRHATKPSIPGGTAYKVGNITQASCISFRLRCAALPATMYGRATR